MRSDLHQVHLRINLLERSLADVRNQHLRNKVNNDIEMNGYTQYSFTINIQIFKISELKYPKWWPFGEISTTWFAIMIIWPFIAIRIMQMMQRTKK